MRRRSQTSVAKQLSAQTLRRPRPIPILKIQIRGQILKMGTQGRTTTTTTMRTRTRTRTRTRKSCKSQRPEKALGTRVWIRGAGRVPSRLPTLLLIPSRSTSLPCLLPPTVLCHLRRLLIPCHPPQWTPSLSRLTLLPCPAAR